ncbi:MAG: tyrosine-type recombinase/integrase [Holophagales bacterium]|nr:tyrosine-type recombinase/integrase [Holophagales bacterium]
MAQRKQSPDLQHRTNRLKIKAGTISSVNIAPGLNLRYRRGIRQNCWQGRYENLELPNEKRKAIYSSAWLPDDHQEADGINILNYRQAYDKVLEWGKRAAKQARLEKLGVEIKDVSNFTVADAMNDWLKMKETTGVRAKGLDDYKYSIQRWIVNCEIGDIPVANLIARKIEQWFDWLCKQPKQGNGHSHSAPKTDEEKRARRATALRILRGLLKPALNYAVKQNESLAQECSPYQWERVLVNTDAARARETVIEPRDWNKLLKEARYDFKQLLIAAKLTGLRHSELRQARVRQYRNGVLYIPKEQTKGNKNFNAHLTEAGITFFNRMVAGKSPDDHILVKRNGTPWGEHSQTKIMTQLCTEAGLLTESGNGKYTFHDIRRTRVSELAAGGLDLELNRRNLGHSSPEIMEDHYLKVADSRFAKEIERAIGDMDWALIQEGTETKIQPLRVANSI